MAKSVVIYVNALQLLPADQQPTNPPDPSKNQVNPAAGRVVRPMSNGTSFRFDTTATLSDINLPQYSLTNVPLLALADSGLGSTGSTTSDEITVALNEALYATFLISDTLEFYDAAGNPINTGSSWQFAEQSDNNPMGTAVQLQSLFKYAPGGAWDGGPSFREQFASASSTQACMIYFNSTQSGTDETFYLVLQDIGNPTSFYYWDPQIKNTD